MSELSLSALTVAGGTLAIASMPGRGGNYADDLDLFGAFKPGLVITMVSNAELETDDLRQLGFDIQALGSRWAHVPVADMGVPDRRTEFAWSAASKDARAALSGGGRVLVHCQAGCGRSGMAVLRLMVECGEAPEAALKRLRAVRPCAVETDAQLAWAAGG
ncbi:protein phosphatase [Rhodobacteraceae bacterium 63075]|nr:protein phosphatase [Rhodobacteraceae bacterium 63075]